MHNYSQDAFVFYGAFQSAFVKNRINKNQGVFNIAPDFLRLEEKTRV